MTTAQVTLETGLGLKHKGAAGDRLPAARDRRLRGDREATPRSCCAAAAAGHRHARSSPPTDEFGYRWLILRDPDFEDLVVALNTVSTQLQDERLRRPPAGRRLPLRGERPSRSTSSTTSSAAASTRSSRRRATRQRDTERELRLKAQLGAELPFEEDIARWFPLWEIPL